MKKILALLALVLGVVSCQTEPEGLDVNVGGEVETTVCVSLPEATRANSAVGAVGTFNNVDWNTYTVRYIMQIFDQNGRASEAEYVAYKDGNENSNSVTFPVRLVPNRDYNFVVWADIVTDAGKTDLHYNLHNGDEGALDLTNITLNDTWVAMDETRDAYTGFYNTKVEGTKYSSSLPINITLTRPFAKLRVVTTDMVELDNLGIEPHNAVVTYTTKFHESFNACNGEYGAETVEKAHSTVFEIKDYADFVGTANKDSHKVLFTDYFFADDSDVVKFVMNVNEENGALIKSNTFNTDIAVRRNYLTTIAGNILTDGNNVEVTVEDTFANYDETGNLINPDYDYATISSEAEFFAAVNSTTGGNYILISDIDVDGVYATTNAATRGANNGKTINIDLNGKTITVNNDSSTDALISLDAGDALIFSGEGTIAASSTNNGKLVAGGTVVVTGAAEVDEDAATVVAGIDALKFILANGGEFTFADNLETDNFEIDSPLTVSTTKPVVINGNGKTITYTGADRAFTVENTDAVKTANVTLNNLTFVNSASYCQRGINFNVAGKLTLNNVTVGKTGTPATYAINLPGSSDGAEVVINNSYLRGDIALNIWGENMVINATNTEFVSYDDEESENYTAIAINNDGITVADNCVLNIEGGKVIAYDENNEPSYAVRNSTITSKVNISSTTEVVGKIVNPQAIVAYEGYSEFYTCETLQSAIDKAAETPATATVRLFKDIELSESVKVAKDQTVTIDLNGKTITGTDNSTGSFGLITNNGNLTVKNGTITLVAKNNRGWNAYSSVISNNPGGNLVVENATIEHFGGTDMAYGIDNLTNGKGTSAVATINEGAIVKSTYSAIRQFLNGVEATNELYVKAGSTLVSPNRSIFFQDPSKNANTGKLVVEAGASVTGDVRLSVTEGSTEWPVEVSVAASALVNGSEVTYGYIPAGYVVENVNGFWTVTKADKVADGLYKNGVTYYVSTADGLATLNTMMVNKSAGKGVVVKLAADIDFTGKTWTTVDSHVDFGCYISELNGNGHTISNLTINGQAMFWRFAGSGNVVIKDITFDDAKVNSNGSINTAVIVGHTYQNVLLDNVDVKNSAITGGYKVAPLIGTVYNESASTITATLKNCDVDNVTVTATSYDFCTTGMVAFVYEDNNDAIAFENCTVKNVKLSAKSNGYYLHAAVYSNGDDLFNEAEGVIVENVTFENI